MYRTMVLTFLVLVVTSLNAQDKLNETFYSGVYQGKPLFIQNPYLAEQQAYCIRQITINNRAVDINYEMSALILNFKGINKYSPVSIHIEYADSTCIPVLLNPESIRYHSVFSFEEITITDSSLVWKSKGESDEGIYEVESFYLGTWEPVESLKSSGIYGGGEYTYFPLYEEGTNKFRIKYSGASQTLYSEEIEHEFYPEPITFKREDGIIVLSRSCGYVVLDQESMEVLVGEGKEIDIVDLKSGEYFIIFNEDQTEIFRKFDSSNVVIKERKEKDN